MMDKTIMVIAGGSFQLPICRRIKEMGYRLINTNLYEDSPAFAYADQFYVSDVKDMDFNLHIAQKHKIHAVLTDQTDIAVPTVAYVAQKMGLPGLTDEHVNLFTDKSKMRAYCDTIHFPSPEYRVCADIEEALTFFRELDDTMIVKPLDAQASRGVYIIRSEQDLNEHFQDAKAYSRSRTAVLCERFVSGCEFTVDGLFINGRHMSLAVSRKRHYSYNKSIASELFFSADDKEYDYKLLKQENDRLMNSLAPRFALTHCEYRYHKGKYYLIEMAARGGGTYISSLIVPAISGVDNYEILIRQSLGEAVDLASFTRQASYKYVVLKFLDARKLAAVQNKKITSIEGMEAIRNMKGILHFDLDLKIGDIPQDARDDRSRIGFYIAASNQEEKIREMEERVYQELKIT